MPADRHTQPTQQPLAGATAQRAAHETLDLAQTVGVMYMRRQALSKAFDKDPLRTLAVAATPATQPEL